VRATIAALAEAVMPVSGSGRKSRGRRRVSMLDANVGAHLRQMRQLHLGRWQGSLDVPPGSIALAAGLPNERDDLLNELFVLSLREVGLDARSVSSAAPDEGPGPDRSNLVSTVFLTYPLKDTLVQWQVVARHFRDRLPQALLVTIRLSPDDRDADQSLVEQSVDMVLRTYEEGVALLTPETPAPA
jgi:hypothetical protein